MVNPIKCLAGIKKTDKHATIKLFSTHSKALNGFIGNNRSVIKIVTSISLYNSRYYGNKGPKIYTKTGDKGKFGSRVAWCQV